MSLFRECLGDCGCGLGDGVADTPLVPATLRTDYVAVYAAPSDPGQGGEPLALFRRGLSVQATREPLRANGFDVVQVDVPRGTPTWQAAEGGYVAGPPWDGRFVWTAARNVAIAPPVVTKKSGGWAAALLAGGTALLLSGYGSRR